MKDQTVSIFASACMFLITFCSKEKGSSNKTRVWECLCPVDFLLHLQFVNYQRHILLGSISAQKRSTFKSKEQLLWCFSFLPSISDCCNCFFSSLGLFGRRFWGRIHHPSSSYPSLVPGPQWPSHLAPFGLWSSKILTQRAGGRVQFAVLNLWWAVQKLSYSSFSNKSNLLLNVCCLSAAIDCFENLPWHQMIYL